MALNSMFTLFKSQSAKPFWLERFAHLSPTEILERLMKQLATSTHEEARHTIFKQMMFLIKLHPKELVNYISRENNMKPLELAFRYQFKPAIDTFKELGGEVRPEYQNEINANRYNSMSRLWANFN